MVVLRYVSGEAPRARRVLERWLVLLCITLAAAGCERAAEDVLRFGLESAPSNLDPRFATDANSGRIIRLLYDSLVDFDSRFQPVPALARWERMGPRHYRFHLREGVHFHDGSPLTAVDVKATYDSVLDPATASPHRAGVENIASVEVVDDHTVDFHLREPDLLLPGRLVIGIVPSEAVADQWPLRRQPVGSGPFRFSAWPVEGRLQLTRLRDGQAFEFVQVKDPNVRVLKLMRGEIHMVQNDLPEELIDYLRKQDGVQVQRGRGTNFTYLGFNLEDEVVGQLAVRQAIAYGVDRQAIIDYVFGGDARPASALLPPEHWAGNDQLPQYQYDPERARRILAEAGYGPQNRPVVVYKTSSNPFRIRLATIIQQQLSEVGIEVDLRTYDWGTFYGDIKAGRFQMFSLSWVGIKTPDIFRYVFHSSAVPPDGANRGRFVSAVADRLIEEAEGEGTWQGQAGVYGRLQRYLWRELPYVPLWYEDHVFVSREDITGYHVAQDGNFDGLKDVEWRPGGGQAVTAKALPETTP